MNNEIYQLHPIWKKFPLIEEDLLRVRAAIAEQIQGPCEEVNQCLRQLCLGEAKLVRPALMILVARCFYGKEKLSQDFINMAATLEMLHLATLIHDDIIDDASTRRGVTSLHQRVGRQVAVYSGDFLLCQVFSGILRYCGGTMEEARFITATIEEILEGELKQRTFEGDFTVKEEDYLDIVQGKTAKLIALVCLQGLRSASHGCGLMSASYGCKEKIHQNMEGLEEMVWDFGESLGIAYQIIDDNLDFALGLQEGDTLGKPINQDFREGHFTLPVIHAMSSYLDSFKALYHKEEFTGQDARALRELVQAAGGFEYSKKIAEEFTSKAMERVEDFPSSIYKEYLEKLVQLLLMRSC